MKQLPKQDYDVLLRFRDDSIKVGAAFEAIVRQQLPDDIQKQAAEDWVMRQPFRATLFLHHLAQVGLASNLEIVSRPSGNRMFVGSASLLEVSTRKQRYAEALGGEQKESRKGRLHRGRKDVYFSDVEAASVTDRESARIGDAQQFEQVGSLE
jgi:hypothetical protein